MDRRVDWYGGDELSLLCKRVLLVCALVCTMYREAAAADGISNAHMNVPAAATLVPGTFEISPTIQFGQVAQDFGAGLGDPTLARQQPLLDSQSNLRLTVGLMSRWEVGMQVPLLLLWEGKQFSAVVERLGFATKVKFFENASETVRISMFAGLLVPLMSRSWVADVGPAIDWLPTSWLSFSLSAGGSIDWLQTVVPGFRYDLGIGAFVWPERLQIVVEWSHVWVFGSPVATEGTLGVALNWYVNPVVTILVGAIFDVVGANQPQNFQAALSLTFAIDVRGRPQKSLR